MVNGLHILIRNKTKKPLAIALSGVGRRLRGRDSGGDRTNVQYKPIWNCHNESPLYNEYILIKKGITEFKEVLCALNQTMHIKWSLKYKCYNYYYYQDKKHVFLAF
jgi:hypothetical protein